MTNQRDAHGRHAHGNGVDVIIVLGRIDLGADEDDLLPLNLDIQVTVDVGPIGVAKPKGDQSPSIPRFASDKTTAVTVIESTSAQTSMKVAYVVSEGMVDTGIAVSNMTKEEAGAVHFAFYMNGQKLKYSTPDMMGPQTTMRILLSELLTAAEHTGSFSGYMTITADFTEADAGVSFRISLGLPRRLLFVTRTQRLEIRSVRARIHAGKGPWPLPCCFFYPMPGRWNRKHR